MKLQYHIMDVDHQSVEEFNIEYIGGVNLWRDIQVPYVDYVVEKVKSYTLKVINVIQINVQCQKEIMHQDNMEIQEENLLNMDYRDRKSTRLNSSHVSISYAVFCL